MGAINKALLENVLENSSHSWQQELSLLARHNVYFETRLADRPSILEAAHHLRYQVYCLERKFENPNEHSTGLESDQYDSHAIQGVLFHRPTDRPIGTVRMILPADCAADGLPIEQLLRENGFDLSDFVDIPNSVEVSRFAISKEFRRRKVESGSFSDAEVKRERHGNLPCLGLIQMLLRQSVELGIEYWAAVMEPQLLRMLALMGIRFQPIGPLVSYHGLRQPSFCHLPVMVRNMALTKPESWAVVTNNGELMPARMDAAAELRQVA